MNLPIAMTNIVTFGIASLTLSMIALVFMLLNRVRRIIKKMNFVQTKPIRLSQHVFRFLIITLWIVVSVALVFLGAFAQSFKSFTHKQLVAEVQCHTLEDEDKTMLLEVTPVLDGQRQATNGFIVKGDQWTLEGDILKWDDWLNFAGLHTMYKLTRVRGRYVSVHDERMKEKTVYSLDAHENDPGWRWLYKHGYRLRFVDAAYGNTVFTYPSEGVTYKVFVTTSGFSLLPRDGVTTGAVR